MMATDAQLTISRSQLTAPWCPVCRSPKRRGQGLCKRCYFSLPLELQAPLWLDRDSIPAMHEWAEKYLLAKQYLRKVGIA